MIEDNKGVKVERRGDEGEEEKLYRWGMWKGEVWREEREGKNGIGK